MGSATSQLSLKKTARRLHKSSECSIVTQLRRGKMKRNAVLGFLIATFVVFFITGGNAAAAGGPKKWILSVGSNFKRTDVQASGGQCQWYWEDAGIALAVSSNPKFGEQVLGKNVSEAIADIAARLPARRSASQLGQTMSTPLFDDAYKSNIQWYWQAIEATRPNPGDGGPIWRLGNFEGSGVKIADIDTGAPAIWDPPVYDPINPGNPVALHPEFDEFDPSHPQDGGVVLFRDDPANPEAVTNLDIWGHGTAVMSIIGARHRGTGAIRGLAPKAILYSYRCRDESWMSDALTGWWRSSQDGVRIINNSWIDWELPADRQDDIVNKLPKIFRRAAMALHRKGVLIVAAAANFGINNTTDRGTFLGNSAFVLIPQDMPHVIVVGGTGPSDYDPTASDLTVYNPIPGSRHVSQKGRPFNLDRVVNTSDSDGAWVFGSDFGPSLALVAPMGMNIKDWNDPNWLFQCVFLSTPYIWEPTWGLHDFWAGTSFSSPITCATAALVIEAFKRYRGVEPSPETIALILIMSSDDLVGPATDDLWVWNGQTMQFEFRQNVKCDRPFKDIRYGFGRVNAQKALEQAVRFASAR
jgi:hypothetical protein